MGCWDFPVIDGGNQMNHSKEAHLRSLPPKFDPQHECSDADRYCLSRYQWQIPLRHEHDASNVVGMRVAARVGE
jgi:hypothetical protein